MAICASAIAIGGLWAKYPTIISHFHFSGGTRVSGILGAFVALRSPTIISSHNITHELKMLIKQCFLNTALHDMFPFANMSRSHCGGIIEAQTHVDNARPCSISRRIKRKPTDAETGSGRPKEVGGSVEWVKNFTLLVPLSGKY
ncbi:hypothetical protein EYF80_009645 [Liparis tanakae]|uniref:Uncharacterized protein n=1 Tax=Liparis tanakae TaxID=230148 RepID=A0A4Z2IRI2_9TELE|nr:hypothetical protein EYF80_009645 [Liparis tanakae]